MAGRYAQTKRALQRALLGLKRRMGGDRSRCEHHNRGLERFEQGLRSAGLATLSERIAAKLSRGEKVRILEIGCGEGRLLLDVLARFEDAVELHGINHERWPVVSKPRGLYATNTRHRVLPAERLRRLGLPTIHLADGEDLSRFPSRHFDFVVSQVTLAHVARKDRVLEESARVLAPEGMFLHEVDHLDQGAVHVGGDDLPRLAIYNQDTRVSTTAYFEGHGIGVRLGKAAGPGIVLATFRKEDAALDLRLSLDLRSTVVLKSLVTDAPAPLWGVRSEYRIAIRA